ncbi:cache domain-containing protein [Myxococcaceae bacterium GXIMD 01537]
MTQEAFDIDESAEAHHRPAPQGAVRPVAPPPPAPSRGRDFLNLGLGLFAVLLAVGWGMAVRGAMDRGIQTQLEADVRGAEHLFTQDRAARQQRMQAECRLMSEDPRLKSALATEGMDRATVEDILVGLRKQSSAEVIAVLNPTARVMASEGLDGLTGLDLSTAAVVRAAQQGTDASAGSWVLGDKLFDVSARALRFGDNTIAFLVLASPINTATLENLHMATGTGAALLISGKAGPSFPPLPSFQGAFAALAQEPAALPLQRRTFDPQAAVAQVVEVPQTMPQVRVALVRMADGVTEPFGAMSWLIWVPSIAAALFGVVAIVRGRLFG